MLKIPWLITVAITLLSPFKSVAGICEDVKTSFHFAEDARINNAYFEKYLIGKQRGVYYIHAVKVVDADFSKIVNVFQDLDNYPKFMLGFKSISVKRISELNLLTGIHFDAPLSPFDSYFTNEVELTNSEFIYQQCWRQLKENDTRVMKKYKFAPLRNEGFWRIEKVADDQSIISYHSAIEPPIWIPQWAYQHFVKHTYVEMFGKIINRVGQ